MKVAFVDTSCLVAIAFGEPSAAAVSRRINAFDEVMASNLLEAELRSAAAREGERLEPEYLNFLSWVIPDRPLSAEISRVLTAGYLRGADLWHLATALFASNKPADLTFLTLDEQQKKVAKAVGFRV